MSGPAEWLTAIGTVAAVIVALFGERLRALLAAPRLEIRLGEGGTDGIRVGVRAELDGKRIDTEKTAGEPCALPARSAGCPRLRRRGRDW
jgi:hypothetical protein